jgi:hypothetical protein
MGFPNTGQWMEYANRGNKSESVPPVANDLTNDAGTIILTNDSGTQVLTSM